MKLSNARLCLDCDEVHGEPQCPACASESFAFIKRWVTAGERRNHAPAANAEGVEKAATYRALLAAEPEPTLTRKLVRGGVVGLAVIGAAGWILQRNIANRNKAQDQAAEPEEPAS